MFYCLLYPFPIAIPGWGGKVGEVAKIQQHTSEYFCPHLVWGWPSWFLCASLDSVLKPGISWQQETMVRKSQQYWLLTPGKGSHLAAWASSSWMERWSILEHVHYGSHILYQFRFQAFVRINSYAPRWISASARAMKSDSWQSPGRVGLRKSA